MEGTDERSERERRRLVGREEKRYREGVRWENDERVNRTAKGEKGVGGKT